jgi:hypothetical protein
MILIMVKKTVSTTGRFSLVDIFTASSGGL